MVLNRCAILQESKAKLLFRDGSDLLQAAASEQDKAIAKERMRKVGALLHGQHPCEDCTRFD